MIRLCNSSVITVAVNGTSKVFEPEELQAKLVASCIAAGVKDTWIAEDIALSVEYSLSEFGEGKVFTISEIDTFVLKILREVGLGNVADHYEAGQHSAGLNTFSVSKDKITETVSRYLGAEGTELSSTADKVHKACLTLGLKEAFPSLILELAKHYHHEDFKAVAKLIKFTQSETSETVWSVTADKIVAALSGRSAEMVSSGVIVVSGVSRLFPSVRLDIKLAEFANTLGVDPPVTELAMLPAFEKLAAAVDEIIDIVEKLHKTALGEDVKLPAYIKFPDAMRFSTEWLCAEWPETAHCMKDIISALIEMLESTVAVRNLSVH